MWKRSRSMVAVVVLVAAVACTDTKSQDGTDSSASTSQAEVTTTTVPGGAFWTDGAEREGWYWLEDPGAVARWEFTDLPDGVGASPLELRAVTSADSLSATGFATVTVQVGTGETELGSIDAVLQGYPVADRPEFALLRGSATLAVLDIADEPTSLWVELATPPAGTLAVLAESVTLGAASTPASALPIDTEVSAAPPSFARLEGEFTTNGDEISGWWWLRDNAHTHYARWEFAAVPGITDGVTAQLHVLATDGVNGGPGVAARFYLAWGFVDADGLPLDPGSEPEDGEKLKAPPPDLTATESVLLTVPNTSPPGDTLGYRAQDTFSIAASDIPADAVGIWFEATRDDPGRLGESTTEHVAFNRASLGLLVPSTGGGDDGTTGNDLEGDGGDLDTGGGTITDPDGQSDADNSADADDVGDLPDGTYHGTLDGETDDWFAFQLDPTQIVDIAVTTPAGLFVDISLYNSYLYRVAPDSSQESDPAFSFAAALGEGGRHYLQIHLLRGTGQYTFTITVRDADDANQHVDAGGTADTALIVGDGDFVGEVTRYDSEDFYVVDVAAGQSLTATLVTLSDENLALELFDDDESSIDYEFAYPEEPAVLFLEAGEARSVYVAVQRPGGDVGGRYRLRLALSGIGECEGTWLYASDFVSSGNDSGYFTSGAEGWYWLQADTSAARFQQSTWYFDELPDDSTVRVFINMPIDAAGPLSAGAYVVYGTTSATGAHSMSAPRYVSFHAVQRESITGADAVGEIAIPHSSLSGSDVDQWWVRLTLADPTDTTGLTVAPVGLGNSTTNLSVCAAGTVDQLDGLDGPVEPDVAQLNYNTAEHILTSNIPMFVDPGGDIDGDGLNQSWEDEAMVLANPVIQLDEEELWLHWRYLLTSNFVEVTPWPSASNPRYIVIGYLNTWAYDAGGGTLQLTDLLVFENHRGDSERIWQAWKVIDEYTVQLEWVNTSAHASYTEHSGVWRVGEQQCNVGYIAAVSVNHPLVAVVSDDEDFVEHTWGFYEEMCDTLHFDGEGRLVLSSAQNKHAMYPSDEVCGDTTLGAMVGLGVPIAGDECGWDTVDDPFGIWWDDDDFNDDTHYRGSGRWQFDVFNVGEPGYPLIDDLDVYSSWEGLDSEQIIALTGEYPNEAVWSGYHPDGSNFCGGLEEGIELALNWWTNDIEVPGKCSSVLGWKFREWQPMFLEALSSRYRVTLHTGTDTGAGTDAMITVQLHDEGGTLLATRLYVGDLENGVTDIVYLAPMALGGPVSRVSLRRTSDSVDLNGDWQVATVTVDDLFTGESVTFTAGQWVEVGAGIVLTT